MNIFILDNNPEKAAKYHNNKHVVKMILESCQLLSTARCVLDNDGESLDGILKPTHKNHPCTIWVRESRENYIWLYNLLSFLLEEYKLRYKKEHSYILLYDVLSSLPRNIPRVPQTPFALAMPDKYKIVSDPVASYRLYYMGEKRHIAKWTNREIPEWWK